METSEFKLQQCLNNIEDRATETWYLGRAAVCDCGTPWTFLLPFFFQKQKHNAFISVRYDNYI